MGTDTKSAGFCALAMALFACSDAMAKCLSPSFDLLEIAWFRYAGAAALFLAIVVWRGLPKRPSSITAQMVRAASMLGATLLLIAALGYQPIAEATALVFLSPALVTTLSVVMLKERVGVAQWLGVIGGFAGVLIVIRPGVEGFSAASSLPLLSAACWAIGITYTRKSLAFDGVVTTLGYSALTGFALLSVMMPIVFRMPSPGQFGVSLIMAASWLGAHICIVLAYRRTNARASRLAPISYTQMIWAIVLGYVLFNATPGLPTIIGCLVIAMSGALSQFRSGVRSA